MFSCPSFPSLNGIVAVPLKTILFCPSYPRPIVRPLTFMSSLTNKFLPIPTPPVTTRVPEAVLVETEFVPVAKIRIVPSVKLL